MKLAIITSRYPSLESPYNHMFVHVRALYFISKGIDVCVFIPSKEYIEYDYQGVKVVRSQPKEIIEELLFYDVYNVHLLNFFPFVKEGGLEIYKYLNQSAKPIALGIHGADVFKYPEYLFDFRLTPQGIAKYLYKNYWNFPHIKSFVKKINQKNNSAIVFPSNWMKDYTENHFQVKLKNGKVIANGIDTKLFSYINLFENRYKLMTLRPFEKKYGIEQAIDVMRFLPDKFTLDIYGKGEDKLIYKKLINKHHLGKRVRIIEKFIDRSQMNSLFHEYGGFFALTLFDSQGVSMCEAMASGLLTISNPVCAIPEFVKENETGLLGVSSEEIAQKIIYTMKSQEEYKRLTQNARKEMENLHWKKTGELELAMLEELISKSV